MQEHWVNDNSEQSGATQPTDSFWRAQLATLEVANRALTARRQELESKITLLETQLGDQARLYSGQLDTLRAQAQTLQASLDDIYRSNIWRWSRPYVRVRQWLKNWRQPRQLQAPIAVPVVSSVPVDLQITVILPAQQGLAATRRCLDSVLSSAPPPTVIAIVTPATDPLVRAFLAEQAAAGTLELFDSDTADTVIAINRSLALALQAGQDIVLLSGAVEVAANGLERLAQCAYSSERIGLVLPFSNHGPLCGYPLPNQDNPPPTDSRATAALAALFAHSNAGQQIPLTAVGASCLYIRHACLQDIGLLDAVHFDSSAATVDFALRALAAGWQQVLCADTFASTLDSTASINTPQSATLHRLYPAYELALWTCREQDPARLFRQRVDLQRLVQSPRQLVLFMTHNRGGGTEKHVRELAHLFADRLDILVLCPERQGIHTLTWLRVGESFCLKVKLPEHYPQLCELLRVLPLQALHIHHTIDFDPVLARLPADLGLPYDYTVHDYYTVCPQINLTTAQGRYCGEPDEIGCHRCLTITPSAPGDTIQTWRARHGQLLTAARRVFAPSADVAKRLRRYFPQLPVLYAPHPEPSITTAIQVWPLATTEPLRIVVLGALNPIKGADLLEACALDAAERQLPLEFHLLGYAYRPLTTTPHSRLIWYGPYTDAQLPALLTAIRPQLAWFPAQWPETYSYTLSACLQAGLPIVAPDLGAFPERLYGRPWTWLLPWRRSALTWNNLFMALREWHFLPATPPLPPVGEQPLPLFSYSDYPPVEPKTLPTSAVLEHLLTVLHTLQSAVIPEN